MRKRTGEGTDDEGVKERAGRCRAQESALLYLLPECALNSCLPLCKPVYPRPCAPLCTPPDPLQGAKAAAAVAERRARSSSASVPHSQGRRIGCGERGHGR
eukprot:888277-Pelagomonas_calceolata.AAC.1